MAGEQRATLRRRLLALLVAGLGGTAAAAVSFAMTVYEAANPPQVPVAEAGETIDTGRWFVTIREARFGAIPPTGSAPPEPKTFLMIEFDLENRSARSANAFSSIIAFDPPIPNLPMPAFYLARDKWFAGPINPGMPERMVAAWEWPAQVDPPQELRLAINSQIYKPRDNLYGAPGWFDREPAAIIELPVAVEAGRPET